MISLARARARGRGRLRVTEADFLAYPLAEASFDFVCANTSLHHMACEQALPSRARLLRPAGRLAVIGLAANGSAADILAGAPGIAVNCYYRAVYREGGPGAPVMAADMTWAQGRAAKGSAADILAGAPGIAVNCYYRAVYREGGPGAPVMAADMTWAQVRTTARRLLPCVRYRRRLLWRYSLLWTKPSGVATARPTRRRRRACRP